MNFVFLTGMVVNLDHVSVFSFDDEGGTLRVAAQHHSLDVEDTKTLLDGIKRYNASKMVLGEMNLCAGSEVAL